MNTLKTKVPNIYKYITKTVEIGLYQWLSFKYHVIQKRRAYLDLNFTTVSAVDYYLILHANSVT